MNNKKAIAILIKSKKRISKETYISNCCLIDLLHNHGLPHQKYLDPPFPLWKYPYPGLPYQKYLDPPFVIAQHQTLKNIQTTSLKKSN